MPGRDAQSTDLSLLQTRAGSFRTAAEVVAGETVRVQEPFPVEVSL